MSRSLHITTATMHLHPADYEGKIEGFIQGKWKTYRESVREENTSRSFL